MVTGCNLPGPVGPVCGSFARWTGVWRDVSRRRGEVANFPQGLLARSAQIRPVSEWRIRPEPRKWCRPTFVLNIDPAFSKAANLTYFG